MSPKLAPIFRPGVLPADSAECPRDRLVLWSLGRGCANRRWISEGEYRQLLRQGIRLVVLEER